MDVFKGQNLLEFSDRFKTDTDCKEYLSFIKSQTSYKCLKCNHTRYQPVKNFGRQCNICAHTESATANTLFHKVNLVLERLFSFVLKCPLQPRALRLVTWEFVMGLQKRLPDFS